MGTFIERHRAYMPTGGYRGAERLQRRLVLFSYLRSRSRSNDSLNTSASATSLTYSQLPTTFMSADQTNFDRTVLFSHPSFLWSVAGD